jgi:general stress protein 26
MNWTDVTEHLTGLAHLSTVSPDGHPHVALAGAVVDGDVLWFGTRASSAKARNIAVNPQVALMWSPAAEVYVRGVAELVDDVSEKRRVWDSGIFPYDLATFFGSPDDEDFVFVKIRPRSATVLTQGDSGIVRRRWIAPITGPSADIGR